MQDMAQQPNGQQGQPMAAPDPVQIVFKSFILNMLPMLDMVTGRKTANLAITAGNFSMQFIVPFSEEQLDGLEEVVAECKRQLSESVMPDPAEFTPFEDKQAEGE
jgi:hypothetical protein